ncbi:MAG: DedA family protein [Solirubrobacteraceae bacterium]
MAMSFGAATPHLPGVLHTLAPTLNHYGYIAVVVLLVLEDFGVPAPGESVLILAAIYAGTGRLDIYLVALLGFLAAVIGDNIGFAIGRFGGQALLQRYGRYVLLTPERLNRATAFFEHHGGKVITIARFVEGLRQANGIIAGASGLHWAKFLTFNVIGAALWVGVWTTVGYLSAGSINSIYGAVSSAGTYLAVGLGVLLLAFIARRAVRAWRARDTHSKL